MKTLTFSSDQVQPIIDGTITETWRIYDDKDLSIDDEVECLDKKTGKAFGKLRINQITTRRYGEIKETGSALELLKAAYGKAIAPDAHVKAIQFSFTAYESPQETAGASFDLKTTELKLYADGGSRGNPGPSASGWVLLDMQDNVVKKAGVYLGITTNNQAEYTALKVGLEEAKKLQPKVMHVFMDSLLVINQIKGIYKVKNRDLFPIYMAIKELAKEFPEITFTHVPRELNKLADAEVNTTLDSIAAR
jgi:ribonuclease HI